MKEKSCFVSWSGGKDACLAMYKACRLGYKPRKLLTMFSRERSISSAHLLPEKLILAQAAALGVEPVIGRALFHEYEAVFVQILRELQKEEIAYGIFGDIDIAEHREWEEKACRQAGLSAVLPLWQQDRRALLEEFITLGFKARIVVVNTAMLPAAFLGRDLSLETVAAVEAAGADACGENGEYHTVVYDGPLFQKPVALRTGREIIPAGGSYIRLAVYVD